MLMDPSFVSLFRLFWDDDSEVNKSTVEIVFTLTRSILRNWMKIQIIQTIIFLDLHLQTYSWKVNGSSVSQFLIFFRFSNPEFRMSAEEAKNLRPACPTDVKEQGIIPFNYNLIFRLNRFKNIYLKVFCTFRTTTNVIFRLNRFKNVHLKVFLHSAAIFVFVRVDRFQHLNFHHFGSFKIAHTFIVLTLKMCFFT